MKKVWLAIALTCVATFHAQANPVLVNQSVTEAEVKAAQQAWCKALVDISSANDRLRTMVLFMSSRQFNLRACAESN